MNENKEIAKQGLENNELLKQKEEEVQRPAEHDLSERFEYDFLIQKTSLNSFKNIYLTRV